VGLAVERQDEIVRSAIESRGGFVFSTEGIRLRRRSRGLVMRSTPRWRVQQALALEGVA
jgi:hypothetical protein